MDIGRMKNYSHLFGIDTAPDATEPVYARLAVGIQNVTPDNSESTDDYTDYSMEGGTLTDVSSVTLGYQFSGVRNYNDAAQNEIAAMLTETGTGRERRAFHVGPDGRREEGLATWTDISPDGGEANDEGEFSATMHWVGMPAVTSPTKTERPTAVSAQAVSVTVGNTARIAVTATPETASSACAFATSDASIATVDADGVVTGVAAGTVTVSIRSMVAPKAANATVTVTVTAA